MGKKLSCWRVVRVRGKLAIMVLTVAFATILFGCEKSADEDIKKIQQDLKDANIKIESQEKEINSLKSQLQEQLKKAEVEATAKENTKIKLSLYDIDDFTYEKKKVNDNISISSEISLKEQVKVVIDETMNRFFKGQKYEVAWNNEKGQEIVVLNLIDEVENGKWYQTFQGSCGGSINSGRIIENILQRDYKGQWIDGLKIKYNGKVADFEHAPLYDTILRKS